MSLRKRPWNRVSLPVYSVSSMGIKPNMHICTYVSAVSMQPKRIMVALYDGTLTLANVLQSDRFVLQLLAEDQFRLVTLLGQRSGFQTDKMATLDKRGLLENWEGFAVLRQCLSVMLLQPVASMPAGDHTMFLCDVIRWKNLREGDALTTRQLQYKGIIRA